MQFYYNSELFTRVKKYQIFFWYHFYHLLYYQLWETDCHKYVYTINSFLLRFHTWEIWGIFIYLLFAPTLWSFSRDFCHCYKPLINFRYKCPSGIAFYDLHFQFREKISQDEDLRTLKNNKWNFNTFRKRSFRDASTNGKLKEISVLNVNETIVKKLNASFILQFCFNTYSFSLVFFFCKSFYIRSAVKKRKI